MRKITLNKRMEDNRKTEDIRRLKKTKNTRKKTEQEG